jgi:hypothetical protein
MLDTAAVELLVQQQIATEVHDRVQEKLQDDSWLQQIDCQVIKFAQDRIQAKFSNAEIMPDLLIAVKASVLEMFETGKIPGIQSFVDLGSVQTAVDHAIENTVQNAIELMSHDLVWLAKIETQINHAMTQHVVSRLSSMDIGQVLRDRVDENMQKTQKKLVPGIDDSSTTHQVSISDQGVEIQSALSANSITAQESLRVKDLAVTGSINVDNKSWQTLSDSISAKTLEKLSSQWRDTLVQQVTTSIQDGGIDFEQVHIGGDPLIQDGFKLSKAIVESNLQTVGTLRTLQVRGESHLNETLSVMNRRIGINTQEPEMALSVWDEEISILLGKHKNKNAYIGTGRSQALSIGVNREPAIGIDTDGLTTIKKLQIGVHKISHDTTVPGWSGTKGDVVFNSNPGINSNVFAWPCLGGFKWKVIRAIE